MDTSSEVDSKIATALLDAVTAAALDAALLGKADASALASLLSTVDGLDTPLEVDTKIANALLGLAAQLASRDASITALQGAKADATLLASYATNAALSASETTPQSALDAILAELAALQLSGSGGVVNAPAWAGFTTWELVRGSNVVRNLHLGAPLSAALANGDDTLSITADCYSTAGTDAAITAALLAYYTSSQVDTLLGDYRTGTAQDAETAGTITAALHGSPQQRLQRGPGHAHRGRSERGWLHPDPGGEPVEHRAHLQLDPGPRAPLRLPLPAWHGLQLRGVHVRGRQRLRPTVRQLRGRPGCLEHGQDVLHSASERSCEAALRGALPAGTVDVYGLQILDATLETGNTAEEEDTAASALLLRHEFLDGGADDVTGHPGRGAAGAHAHHVRQLPGALQQPELRGLGQLHGGRLPAGGLRHDPERLRLEHCAHLHADTGETLLLRLPVQAGHGLQLGDVRQRGRQRLRGRHRHLPRHALAGCLEHGAPGLLGAAGRSHKAALRSLRRLDPRAGAAVGGHAGPVQHADQGLGLRGRVGLRDGPAGGLAGPHGLGHAGRAHRAGQRGLRPAAVQRRELHRRVHHGRGRLGRSLLRSAHSHRHRRRGHAVVHRGRVRQLAEHHGRGQRAC